MIEFQLTNRMWPRAHAVVRNEGEVVALCDLLLLPPWEKEDIFTLPWEFFFDQLKTGLFAELYNSDEDEVGFLCIHWVSAKVSVDAYPSFRLLFPNATWEN